MKVHELIAKLQEMPQDAEVVAQRFVDSGCSTCGGWDEDFIVDDVFDFETRVQIDVGHEQP